MRYQLVLLFSFLLWLLPPLAAPAAQPAPEAEIARLIAVLGHSGCAFERNGSWYDAAKAKAHLQDKYDYLRKRGLADTTEHFIEQAASNSSLSGKPYHVRCPGEPVQPSADWFRRQLRDLRTTAVGD